MSKPTSNSISTDTQSSSVESKALKSDNQVTKHLPDEINSQDVIQEITTPLNEQAQHAVQEIAQSVEEISEHEVARKELDVDGKKKKEESDELLQDLTEAPVKELNSEGGMLLAENTAAPAANASDAGAAEAGAGGGVVDSVGAAVASVPVAPLIGLGALAMAGGGGSSAAAVGFTISGAISLGKLSSAVGLELQGFKSDGSEIAGAGLVNNDGTFQFVATENVSGPIMLRLVDTDPGANYTDEASGNSVDMTSDLRVIIGSATDAESVAITPLTELAARKMIGDTGGDGGDAAIAFANVTATTVSSTNTLVANAFGLTDITKAAATLDDATGYAAADEAAQAYGQVLAAISGAEASTGLSTQDILNTLVASISDDGVEQGAVDLIVAGAEYVEANAPAAVQTLATTAAISTKLSSNLSGSVSKVDISTDSGTLATDFITNSTAQTVTATLGAALDNGTAGDASDDLKLWGSIDGGTTWTDISSKVTGTAVSWDGVTLEAGANKIKLALTSAEVTEGDDVAANVVGKVTTQTVTVDATAPTFDTTEEGTNDAAVDVAENTQLAYASEVTETSKVKFSLTGDDAALFRVDSSGRIHFKEAPDYESPRDANGDNAYEVNLIATDFAGNVSDPHAVTITVTNANEAPVFSRELVTNGSFADTETPVWTGAVNIVNGVNVASQDTEGQPSYTVNISNVIDLDPQQSYTITFDAKAAEARDMVVGLGMSADPWFSRTETVSLTTEWQTFTLTMPAQEGAPNYNLFGDATSRVLFDMGADTGDVYIDDVSVVAVVEHVTNGDFADANEGWTGNAFNVVNGVNYANVEAAGNAWDVNLSGAISVVAGETYTLTFDAKGTADRTMIAGIGQNYGDYVSSTDTVTLTADWKTYTINVSAENGIGGDASRVFFDMGADAGEVYLDNVSLTRPINFAENATGTVYTAAAVDDDGDAIAYSLSGADADLFAIDESTGVITFKAAPNYEAPKDSGADNTYNLTITATDDADPALSSSQDIEVHVTDVNEAPAVTSAATASINENSATTDVVYTATASDEDGDDITFSLSGTDAASFTLGADSGELTFNASPDHETKDSYSVTITANDGTVDSDAQTVTVSVNDVNEAPVATDIQSAPSAVVEQSYSYDASVLFTDEDDGATLTYSATGLPTGLSIDSATGVISGTAPADESLTNAIKVTASDGKLSDFTEFNLAVVRAPVILSIATNDAIAVDGDSVTLTVTMSESVTVAGAGSMTLVFDVAGSDWTVTKTLADGDKSNTFVMDATAVPLVGDDNTVTLKSITVADSTVTGDDSGEAFDTSTVGVVVSDFAIDNADPVFTSDDTVSVDENATGAVYTATATDATDVTYTLASSGDGSSFTIDGGVVSFDSAPDYETKNSYTFTVNAADASGNTSSQTVAVSVNNLNDNAPTVVSDNATSEVTYKSGAVISDSIADWFTDADGDDLTFSLTGDNVGLSVDSSTGAITGTVTSKGSYALKVTATDGTNSVSQDVDVTVVDAPTLSSANLDDNTKFDVTSNIVLTASSAVTKGTGSINIVETDNTDNTVTIDVTSDQVSISGSTITINPTVDLDFGTSYHITVDENAFGIDIGEQDLLGSVAVSDATAINFTTVTPSATDTGAASEAMTSAGGMEASFSWFAAEDRGNNAPTAARSQETIEFGDDTVPVALVITNKSNSAISSLDFNIKVNAFSGEDMVYFDDTTQGLDPATLRDSIIDNVIVDATEGLDGVVLNTAIGGGSYGGYIDLIFDDSVTVNFDLLGSYAGLQQMLGVDSSVYPLYYG